MNETSIRTMMDDVRKLKGKHMRAERKTSALGVAVEGLECCTQHMIKVVRRKGIEGTSGWRSWHEQLDLLQATLLKDSEVVSVMMQGHDMVVLARSEKGNQGLMDKCKTLNSSIVGCLCLKMKPSLRACIENLRPLHLAEFVRC